MNQLAKDKIFKARTSLLLSHFFWGKLALYLQMVERPDIPTLAVDGKHIFYNPDFILGLDDDLVKSAIVHEIGHCMFEHIGRRLNRDPRLWNIAGDYAINLMIHDTVDKNGKKEFKLGQGWLFSEKYRDMSAEHIYDLLKSQVEKNGGKGKDDGLGEPLCDILDGSQSAAEQATQDLEWKVAVAQAANEAQKRGNLPANMQRFVDSLMAPKVPWREVLQRFINQVSKDDYTWVRPNRRFVASGLYAPSMYSERMGPITVAIDTSGSIDEPTLSAFGAEVRAIISQARPEKVTVIYCDAQVNHVDEFGPDDELHFDMHGGGGTDFRPPFEHVKESGENPVAFVYLTDMYGSFPKGADFPVLWCATSDIQGPFGETVRLEI